MTENGRENNSRILTASGAIPLNNEYMAESRKNIYNNVMRNIESMARDVEEYKNKTGKDKPKSVVLEDNSCNVISFLGGRGSGKTSMLLTVLKQLEKNEIEYIQENDTEKKENTRLKSYVVPIIDPDKFNFEKDALGWVIFSFAKEIKDIEEDVKDYKYCKDDGKKELVESYNKLKKSYLKSRENYLINTASIMGGTAEYNKMTEELITSDINMTKYFIEFIDSFIKTLDIDLIFFSFDDVDLCPEQGPAIIRTIIDYMSSHPAIVTFVLGDLNLFEESLAVDMVNRSKVPFEMITNDTDRKLGFNFEDKKETARRILTKIMPLHLRNKLEPLTTKEKMDFVHTSYHNSDKNKDKTLEKLMKEIELSEEYRLYDLFKYPIEKMEKMRFEITGKKIEKSIDINKFEEKYTKYEILLPSVPRELNMLYSELSIIKNNKENIFENIYKIFIERDIKNNKYQYDEIKNILTKQSNLKNTIEYDSERIVDNNIQELPINVKNDNNTIKFDIKESLKIKFMFDLKTFVEWKESFENLIKAEYIYKFNKEDKLKIDNNKLFMYDDYFFEYKENYKYQIKEIEGETPLNILLEIVKYEEDKYKDINELKLEVSNIINEYLKKMTERTDVYIFAKEDIEYNKAYDKFIQTINQYIYCDFIKKSQNYYFYKTSEYFLENVKEIEEIEKIDKINREIIVLLITSKLIREEKYIILGINYIIKSYKKIENIIKKMENKNLKLTIDNIGNEIKQNKMKIENYLKNNYKKYAYLARVFAYYNEKISRNIIRDNISSSTILDCYEEAYKLDRENIDEYVQCLYREKRYETLNVILGEAVKNNSKNVSLISEYALFKATIMKDYSEAERLFKNAIEINGNDTTFIRNYARYYEVVKRDKNEARRLYNIAYDSNKSDVSTRLMYARFAKNMGSLDYARIIYSNAYNLAPFDVEIAMEYAVLMGGELIKDKIKEYESIEKKSEIQLKAFINRNFNEIDKYYEDAKNIMEIFDNKDVLYIMEMKTYLEHLKYENLLKIKEYNIDNLFQNLYKENRILEQIKKNVKEMYRDSYVFDYGNLTLINRYLLFLIETEKSNDKKTIIKIFRQGFSIDANNIPLLIQYGKFLDEVEKNYKEAEKQYLKVLTIEPNNEEVIELYEELKEKVEKEEKKTQRTTDTKIMNEVKKFNVNLDTKMNEFFNTINERINKLEEKQ